MIQAKTIDRMTKRLKSSVHSGFGTPIRIEWRSVSGGTDDVVFNITDGGTVTRNVLNTKGILSVVKAEQSKMVDHTKLVNRDGIWFIDTDVNLQNRADFIVVQLMKDEFYDGSGIGSASVFTDSSAAWTIDQWKGFSLIVSDKRFVISSNTATALTVVLNGQTLPTSSTAYEIMGAKEWYPVASAPPIGENMDMPLGEYQGLQGVYCTQVPERGTE